METKEELNLLNNRVERLNKEYSINAPVLIIKTELKLIKESCKMLLKKLK